MAINPGDFQTIHHVAQLAVLASLVRGVAAAESENEDALEAVVITLRNPRDVLAPIDVEFFGPGAVPLGGMSI